MPASPTDERLLDKLRAAVGDKNLITDQDKKDPYCTGFRFGSGSAIAPGVDTSRPRRESPGLHRDTSTGRIGEGPWGRAVAREDGRFVLDTATGGRTTSVDDIVSDGIAFIPERSGWDARCAVGQSG